MNLIQNLNKLKLLNLELFLISLMILSLPSLEAPKNIFLIFFVLTALFRHFHSYPLKIWRNWDWIFVSIIVSGFLSTIFAGIQNGDEWKGFRVLLTFICVGWLLSRADYTKKQIGWIFLLLIVGTLPPLIFGLWEVFFLHSKDSLQLHSVGHVNHSAIYLSIIFGASIGWSLALWSSASNFQKKLLFIMPIFFYLSIIISESRAAFLVATLIAFIILFLIKNKKIILITAISFLALLVTMSIFNAPILIKQSKYIASHDILSGRVAIWNTTIEAARFNPLLGIGIDNRANVTKADVKKSIESREETFEENKYNFSFKHAHSFYLTQIAERGVIGSFVTLTFILFWLKELIYSRRSLENSPQDLYLWCGSFSAWLATFGIGFVNTTFHHEHGILACLFLGLHLAYLRKNK
ncbi:O-antigen ligase family protein [Candidatus Methylopumilus universalis]|uniref:O-antigen ligase family protein n=1 Tax=Candidatus Methylopumilus universalis TaxID=2588536 RepID=UPI00112364B1|nr:O-antigen ligase family protein [Candidatus Methylopumilus universalis]QDC47500.1 O-antigen ligase family protein [Candidatus Methylopumilus universalis]QDC72033.1 O-antigen ligase family protein [Candidatus Methylopumilus universalis]